MQQLKSQPYRKASVWCFILIRFLCSILTAQSKTGNILQENQDSQRSPTVSLTQLNLLEHRLDKCSQMTSPKPDEKAFWNYLLHGPLRVPCFLLMLQFHSTFLEISVTPPQMFLVCKLGLPNTLSTDGTLPSGFCVQLFSHKRNLSHSKPCQVPKQSITGTTIGQLN